MSLSPSEATHNCSFLFIPTVSRGLCSPLSPSTASSLLHPVPCHAQASPALKETSLPRVHTPSRVGETWALLCSPSQSTPSSFISCLLLGPLQFRFGTPLISSSQPLCVCIMCVRYRYGGECRGAWKSGEHLPLPSRRCPLLSNTLCARLAAL